jgi:hypothetical protein
LPTYWLKALGGGPRIGKMPDDWRSIGPGLFTQRVTFAQNSSVRPGDKVILYGAGWGAFFASGTAESYPFEVTEGDPWYEPDDPWSWHVRFSLEHHVDAIHDGVPLESLNVDDRDLRVAMRRRSHIRLSSREYEAGITALAAKEDSLRQLM